MASPTYRTSGEQNLSLNIEVTRGHDQNFFVESRHQVQALVLSQDENPIASWGNPEELIFPRSAIKWLQSLLMIESGALEKFNLGAAEIALACASHHGAQEHLEILQTWLQKIALSENALVCSPHLPYDKEAAHRLIQKNQSPLRLHNNCSGKHLGLLSAALSRGMTDLRYEKTTHPLQQSIQKLLEEWGGSPLRNQAWGVDGCGIPTYKISLLALAKIMAKFVNEKAPAHKKSIGLIREALKKHPILLGGKSSLCSQVAQLTQGEVMIKTGAEGVYAGFSLRTSCSFAVKVLDGATRASELATLWICQRYAGFTDSELKSLEARIYPQILNWGDQLVGRLQVKEVVSSNKML